MKMKRVEEATPVKELRIREFLGYLVLDVFVVGKDPYLLQGNNVVDGGGEVIGYCVDTLGTILGNIFKTPALSPI